MKMKSLIYGIQGFLVVVLIALPAYADRNAARDVAMNCKVELDTYCKDVTPGKGRIFACLYAYSDKLSQQCQDTVLDMTEDFRLISAAATFVRDECREELDRFCNDVAPGEGRLINCLERHDDKISRSCKAALKDVGLKD